MSIVEPIPEKGRRIKREDLKRLCNLLIAENVMYQSHRDYGYGYGYVTCAYCGANSDRNIWDITHRPTCAIFFIEQFMKDLELG